MHSAYSASHARETHAGWQCDRRNVNNALHAQNTHNTWTEMHNSILGGEIKTIQTGLKTLNLVIHLRE